MKGWDGVRENEEEEEQENPIKFVLLSFTFRPPLLLPTPSQKGGQVPIKPKQNVTHAYLATDWGPVLAHTCLCSVHRRANLEMRSR